MLSAVNLLLYCGSDRVVSSIPTPLCESNRRGTARKTLDGARQRKDIATTGEKMHDKFTPFLLVVATS